MFDPEKLIRKGRPKGHIKEVLIRSLLAGTTYLIVLIAVLRAGQANLDDAA